MKPGAYPRARKIVEDHELKYGPIPDPLELVTAIADALDFIELASVPHRENATDPDEAEQPMPKGGFTDTQIMETNYAAICNKPSKLGYRVSSDHLRWCYELIRKIPQGIGA